MPFTAYGQMSESQSTSLPVARSKTRDDPGKIMAPTLSWTVEVSGSMARVPMSPQSVTLRDLPLSLRLTPDESIWTESCYKFTRSSVQSMLEEAGMRLERWSTDARSLFALAVARPE